MPDGGSWPDDEENSEQEEEPGGYWGLTLLTYWGLRLWFTEGSTVPALGQVHANLVFPS